jgi:hypothetical protein
MKTPACDPSDFCIALREESTLFIPEIAKSAGTPKRFQHVSPFAFFEVGFIGWIVRVSFAFNLDVSFDGSALGVVQPDFIWPSFVIVGFTEEGPVTIPAPGCRPLGQNPFFSSPSFPTSSSCRNRSTAVWDKQMRCKSGTRYGQCCGVLMRIADRQCVPNTMFLVLRAGEMSLRSLPVRNVTKERLQL